MEITRNMNVAGVPWPGVQREYSKDEKDRGFSVAISRVTTGLNSRKIFL